jgi:hypothetical protein
MAQACALFGSSPNIMLSGQEEVPAVSTTGFGMGRITVSRDKKVSGSIKVSEMAVIAAHIHMGAMGKIGPPIITLEKLSSRVWGVPFNSVLTDGQYGSYLAGELYVNVHTERFRGGEIRGQLRPRRK